MGWTTCEVDEGSAAGDGAARDIKNDCTSLDISTPRGVQDVTGLDKTAMERLLLLSDVSVTLNGVFDVTAALSHVVLSTAASTVGLRTVTLTIAAASLVEEMFLTDYSLSRPGDGSFTWTAPLVLGNGTFTAWA
jgi:hypothetical protein